MVLLDGMRNSHRRRARGPVYPERQMPLMPRDDHALVHELSDKQTAKTHVSEIALGCPSRRIVLNESATERC